MTIAPARPTGAPAPAPHTAESHVLDRNFESWESRGLKPGTRVLSTYAGVERSSLLVPLECVCPYVADVAQLRIANLDRSDPPGFVAERVHRSPDFNKNTLAISSAARMPQIEVDCRVSGFDVEETPIHWRLICRHVACRFMNVGNYRYRANGEVFDLEWQGRAFSPKFTLFGERDENLFYDFGGAPGSGVIGGGHALLSVAVKPRGAQRTLFDYVHLRITGTNPTRQELNTHLASRLTGRNTNLLRIIEPIPQKESGCRQFAENQGSSMTLPVPHKNGTKCKVPLSWPKDPPNYPLISPDFGVGLMQLTRLPGQTIPPQMLWSWHDSLIAGVNHFFGKLRATFRAGISWRDWAYKAWRAYNGSGSAAEKYAANLDTIAGAKLDRGAVPATFNLRTELADLARPTDPGKAPDWPPWGQDSEPCP